MPRRLTLTAALLMAVAGPVCAQTAQAGPFDSQGVLAAGNAEIQLDWSGIPLILSWTENGNQLVQPGPAEPLDPPFEGVCNESGAAALSRINAAGIEEEVTYWLDSDDRSLRIELNWRNTGSEPLAFEPRMLIPLRENPVWPLIEFEVSAVLSTTEQPYHGVVLITSPRSPRAIVNACGIQSMVWRSQTLEPGATFSDELQLQIAWPDTDSTN